MGNVCCKYSAIDYPTKTEAPATQRLQPEVVVAKVEPHSVRVIDKLGRPAIEALLKEAEQALATDPVRTPKNKLVTERFKLFNNEYNFFADFSDLPSGNKLHQYSHQMDYPFTPELHFLFSLQQSLESFGKIDDSLDQLEVLNFVVDGDIIVLLTRNRTKKILVVEPRSFLVMRVIKRISKNEFLEAQRSIQLTELGTQEPWKTLASEQINLAEIRIGAVHVKREGDQITMRSLTNIDILSSTGPTILKMALKGKFSKYHKNSLTETLRFLINTKEGDYRNLRWFTNDVSEINRIFQENRELVAKRGVNLAELDKAEAQEVSSVLQSQASGSRKDSGSQPVPSIKIEQQDSLSKPVTPQERKTSDPIPPVSQPVQPEPRKASEHIAPVPPKKSEEIKLPEKQPEPKKSVDIKPAEIAERKSSGVKEVAQHLEAAKPHEEAVKHVEALPVPAHLEQAKPIEAHAVVNDAPVVVSGLAHTTPAELPHIAPEEPKQTFPDVETAKDFAEAMKDAPVEPITNFPGVDTAKDFAEEMKDAPVEPAHQPKDSPHLEESALTQATEHTATTEAHHEAEPHDAVDDHDDHQEGQTEEQGAGGAEKKKKKKKKGK